MDGLHVPPDQQEAVAVRVAVVAADAVLDVCPRSSLHCEDVQELQDLKEKVARALTKLLYQRLIDAGPSIPFSQDELLDLSLDGQWSSRRRKMRALELLLRCEPDEVAVFRSEDLNHASEITSCDAELPENVYCVLSRTVKTYEQRAQLPPIAETLPLFLRWYFLLGPQRLWRDERTSGKRQSQTEIRRMLGEQSGKRSASSLIPHEQSDTSKRFRADPRFHRTFDASVKFSLRSGFSLLLVSLTDKQPSPVIHRLWSNSVVRPIVFASFFLSEWDWQSESGACVISRLSSAMIERGFPKLVVLDLRNDSVVGHLSGARMIDANEVADWLSEIAADHGPQNEQQQQQQQPNHRQEYRYQQQQQQQHGEEYRDAQEVNWQQEDGTQGQETEVDWSQRDVRKRRSFDILARVLTESANSLLDAPFSAAGRLASLLAQGLRLDSPIDRNGSTVLHRALSNPSENMSLIRILSQRSEIWSLLSIVNRLGNDPIHDLDRRTAAGRLVVEILSGYQKLCMIFCWQYLRRQKQILHSMMDAGIHFNRRAGVPAECSQDLSLLQLRLAGIRGSLKIGLGSVPLEVAKLIHEHLQAPLAS